MSSAVAETIFFGYLLLGAITTAYATRRSKRGPVRVFAFATTFSLFFGLGLIVGHGALPAPALLIILSCPFIDCASIYGDAQTAALLTIVPLLIQWLIALAVSFLVWFVYTRVRSRDPDRDLR